MEAFTNPASPRITGQLDSKGRVTVPARIRNKLGLEKGDKIFLRLESSNIIQREVEDYRQALRFVSQFESVSSFSFNEGVVEVALDER